MSTTTTTTTPTRQQRQAEDARVIGAVRKQVIDLLKDCDFSQLT